MKFEDTADTAASIHRAKNGWVVNSRWDGPSYVATSLHEIATLVEGEAPAKEAVAQTYSSYAEGFSANDLYTTKSFAAAQTYSSYAEGFSANDLYTIKSFAAAGRKIDAIKLLRNCFTARLNLKEAKEIVEVFCG